MPARGLARRHPAHMQVELSQWGTHGPRPEPNHALDALFGAMTASAECTVAGSLAHVWALVSDITRIGEFSPECIEAWWVPGSAPRAVGGRFEGRNRAVVGDIAYDWIRPCDVLLWEPATHFAWSVGDRFDGTPATTWAFRLRSLGNSVLLRQEFAHCPDGLSGLRVSVESDPTRAADQVQARTGELHRAMVSTLARMKQVLEAPNRS
jgi:hypothetical protein